MLRRPTLWAIRENLPEKDRQLLRALNAYVQRISALRPTAVSADDDDLRFSKVAWKFKSLVGALIHRTVALSDGAAISMNANSTLTSMLAIRALIETVAVIGFLRVQLGVALENKNIADIDSMANKWLFATRDPEYLPEWEESKAINIISVFEKISKADPFMKMVFGHYLRLSERCHPNSAGGLFMFAALDQKAGILSFAGEQRPEINLADQYKGLTVLLYSEHWLADLLAFIPEVVRLQMGPDEPTGG